MRAASFAAFAEMRTFVDLTGSGSSFIYPLLAAWAQAHQKASGNAVNYHAVGSISGLKQLQAGTADFAVTEQPLNPTDLAARGLVQVPLAVGAVVPVLNVEAVTPGQAQLTPDVLAGVHLGRIQRWNAPEIATLNPGLPLPSIDVLPAYRADASGTTLLFTTYLAGASAAFRTALGASTSPRWPVGIGGKGNDGVAANVQKLKGVLGYVALPYARKNRLSTTRLPDAEGAFIQADLNTVQAAAAAMTWDKTTYAVSADSSPGGAWPITGPSYLLYSTADTGKAAAVQQFLDRAYNSGDDATGLEYVPVPASVQEAVRASWK